MKESCCCLYTIRLDATSFSPSKSQRKLYRRWKSFLAGERDSSDDKVMSQLQGPSYDHMDQDLDPEDLETAEQEQHRSELQGCLAQAIANCVSSGSIKLSSQSQGLDNLLPRIKVLNQKQKKVLGNGFCFTSPVAFAIAKAQSHSSDAAAEVENLANIISLEFNTDPGDSSITASSLKGHINFKKTVILKEETGAGSRAKRNPQGSNARQPMRQPKGHVFEMKMVQAAACSFDEASFDLYRRYQVSQHGDKPDEVTRESYRRFLCDSPLFDDLSDENQPTTYGSFHQQYYVDGKLVAVGVVDVLPRCLSSVYLFWDPDLAHLALGKLTALLEIQWVQSLKPLPSSPHQLQWYYMGFYIPTCPKMRYKADYSPSDLLSPSTQLWVRLDDTIRLTLESLERPFLELSDINGTMKLSNLSFSSALGDENVDDVLILLNSETILSWGDLKLRLRSRGQGQNIEKTIKVWQSEVGKGLKLHYSI